MSRRLGWRPAAYALVVAANLIGLAVGVREVSVPAQSLLMPVLALSAWKLARGRTRAWVLAALFGSWLGDTLPRFVAPEYELVVLIGCFAVAQVCWVVALWPRTPVQRHRALIALLVGLGPSIWLVAQCLPGAGVLTPAVIGYAGLLLLTVTRAAAWGLLGLAGGVLFWVSDGLIAITSFVPQWRFAGSDPAIMATYAAAQSLLVAALFFSARPIDRAGPKAKVSDPDR